MKKLEVRKLDKLVEIKVDGKVTEKECWGKRAKWCDYSGKVDDKVVIKNWDSPLFMRYMNYKLNDCKAERFAIVQLYRSGVILNRFTKESIFTLLYSFSSAVTNWIFNICARQM